VAASFEEIAQSYADERPKYEALAEGLGKRLGSELERRGLEVFVQWRAKEIDSFVKKALRKGYANPLSEISDKAGVRVIVHFEADVAVVREIIIDLCTVHREETKLQALAYDQLGYLGVHLDVSVLDDAFDFAQDVADLPAEVQIHTKAQSAWAVVSHDLLYKSPQELSEEIRRGITRLVALVELFDGEVARFRGEIEQSPAYSEMQVLQFLDDAIVRYTPRRPDKRLSGIVIPPLVRLYDVEPEEIYDHAIASFVQRNDFQLKQLFDQYSDDYRANPLLFQPESLLIFDRLEQEPDRTRMAWPQEIPLDLLESMATIWGVEV
jgi:ppGpp synthetase/RelA/SpoT-type nucleotidyltranferase